MLINALRTTGIQRIIYFKVYFLNIFLPRKAPSPAMQPNKLTDNSVLSQQHLTRVAVVIAYGSKSNKTQYKKPLIPKLISNNDT